MQNVKHTFKKLFEIIKRTKNAIANTLTQFTISSLIQRERIDLTITTKNKTKIMYEAHFSLFSKIFTNDIKNYTYSKFMFDDDSLSIRKIKHAIYKTTSNKTSKQNNYINRIIRKFVNTKAKQMRSLFERC